MIGGANEIFINDVMQLRRHGQWVELVLIVVFDT